jgi:Protein of unknown function (DUF3617)
MHWTILGLSMAGLTAVLLAAAAESARPAEPIKLNIKLGLWEIATQANISGAPPIPEDALAKMSPEQRARMQAAIQASMADVAKPKLAKHCVTQEKVAQGFNLDRQHDSTACQKKLITNSSSELKLTETCAEDNGSTSIDEHVQLNNSDQVTGTVHFVKNSGGKTMTVDSTIKGQWLAASCGDIKDYELEK